MRGPFWHFVHTRLLAVLVTAAGTTSLATSTEPVPVPTVTRVPGDIPGSQDRNYPFFASDIVLANFGYVEEEFFYAGTAHTYANAAPGADAEIVKSGVPYRSRLLVRRPAAPARFNGVVVVEWLNVTNGYDTDVLWLYQKEFLVREGYVWVGVSAQDGGVSRPPNGIKVWSPTRYGSLDLTGGGTADASLNFDIYAQAGAAVRHVPQVLGGLVPRYVIAVGQSQSAGRLGPYLNGVHQRAPVFDAALLTVNNAPIRTDLSIPVIKVLSETERATSRLEGDQAKVRVWPVAGATHSEQYSLVSRAAFLKRDLNQDAFDPCETPARSRVEIRYVYNAATDALVRWLRTGAQPPHAPAFTYDETAPITSGGRGPGEKPVKRDAHQNILGGIRLPEMDVPVATESAELCGLGGTHVPFDAATVNALYPTHDVYVKRVTDAAEAAVAQGFLLRADAKQEVDTARRSIYGHQWTCGPLCADVRQFPKNPSSMLLAKQTSFLMIKGGESLVDIADDVTARIAEGDTVVGQMRVKYGAAVAALDRYEALVKALEAKRDLSPETARLLIDEATTLRALVAARASGPSRSFRHP
jgi:hypothetical protein